MSNFTLRLTEPLFLVILDFLIFCKWYIHTINVIPLSTILVFTTNPFHIMIEHLLNKMKTALCAFFLIVDVLTFWKIETNYFGYTWAIQPPFVFNLWLIYINRRENFLIVFMQKKTDDIKETPGEKSFQQNTKLIICNFH